MARPTRLVGINYTGLAVYFITTCTLDRRKSFVASDFCEESRDALSSISKDCGFSVTAYCFMPDHIHKLVEATREDASLPELVYTWKKRTGFSWSRRTGSRLWQKGYWDRVLRDDDDPLSYARYAIENPFRAGLVTNVKDYPWIGSDRYSIDEILAACQLDLKSGWHR